MDCAACEKMINDVGGVAQTPDAVKTAQDFYNGPDYCTASGATDPDGCKKFVDSFVPSALPAMGYSVQLAKTALCQAVYNLCK